MAEFSLPQNSKVRKDGRVFKAPAGTKNVRVFKIYRFDPIRARTPGSTATKSTWTPAARWCWTR